MKFTQIGMLVFVALLGSCIAYKSAAGTGQKQKKNQAVEQLEPPQNLEQSNSSMTCRAGRVQTRNDENRRESYFECLHSAAGVTPQMQGCIDEEMSFQVRRLRDIHQRLINAADKQEQPEFKAAQEEWQLDRDLTCSSVGQGGQGAP